MIKIEDMNNLQGAERFGECNSCGERKDIAKIIFQCDELPPQHSFMICHICADKLVKKLKW